MNRLAIGALACAAAFTGAANAEVIGQMQLVESNKDVFENVVDVYHFAVVSSDTAIGALDFTSATGGGFSGAFVNGDSTFRTDSGLPVFGPITLADTFFVSPVANPTAVQTTDDGEVLEAAYAFAASPIPAGTEFVAAVFSVAAGDAAPSFNGGFATTVDGRDLLIIPEPASLALLGLAGVAVLGRRRAA